MSHAGASAATPKLFTPFRLGDLELKNRVAMAPLTRNRANKHDDAPNALNVEYYRQRAGAGLIITEATQISQQGQGYIWTPGIYRDAQVDGWKAVTDAVHEADGRIFAQLWHVGRVSHVSLQPDNQAPVAPSAVLAKTKTYIESGFAEVSQPRALGLEEIPGIIADFVRAAENARAAGFDGIELHGAHGYLLDQFLRDGSNQRQDAYGGPIENRVRLTLEVVDAVTKVFPKERVGIRISPVSPANDARDTDPQALFGHLVTEPTSAASPSSMSSRAQRAMRATICPSTTSACARPSAAPISPITASPANSLSTWLRRARPISSPSAGSSSPIPTCRNGSGWTPRSTRRTPRLSMAATPRATPITRHSRRPSACTPRAEGGQPALRASLFCPQVFRRRRHGRACSGRDARLYGRPCRAAPIV